MLRPMVDGNGHAALPFVRGLTRPGSVVGMSRRRFGVPNGRYTLFVLAGRASPREVDNRPGDETFRQNRSLGRHYHGAGGCRGYRLLYAVQHSRMVRGVRDAGAPRDHAHRLSRTWNPRGPSAADRPRTVRIHIPGLVGSASRWSCALAAVGGASQLARAHTGSRVRFLSGIRHSLPGQFRRNLGVRSRGVTDRR